MAVINSIADAVVTKLNAATFTQSFTAVRKYAPIYRLKDMDTLHVTVVPSSEDISPVNRADTEHEYTIDVGIQKRFSSDANTTIDPLMDLVQEVSDEFTGAGLAGYTSAHWVRTTVDPIFAPDHMSKVRQFTSVVRLAYKVFR